MKDTIFWVWVIGLLACASVSMMGCGTPEGPAVARCVEKCESVNADYASVSPSDGALATDCYCKFPIYHNTNGASPVVGPKK